MAFRTQSSPPFWSGRNHGEFCTQPVHLQMEKLLPALSDLPRIKEQVRKNLTKAFSSESGMCFPLTLCMFSPVVPLALLQCLTQCYIQQMFILSQCKVLFTTLHYSKFSTFLACLTSSIVVWEKNETVALI